MPGQEHTFVRDEVFPSWWPNAVQRFISSAALNFRLRQVAGSATTIEVPAADPEIAAIGVNGPWRYNVATVQRAHPGGAAGTYDVFVTAKASDIRNAPAPYSDFTDYSFGLDIRAAGSTPPIVAGVVDIYRKVGEVDWNGAALTAIRQTVGSILSTDQITPTAKSAAETPLRVVGAAGQTADYLRVETNIGGSVLRVDSANMLRATGDVRANDGAPTQVALSSVAGAAAVAFGSAGDAAIRRPAVGVLRTDAGVALGVNTTPAAGALLVLNDVTARQGAAAEALLGSIAGAAGLQLGGDTTFTRTGAGILRASGTLNAISGYQVNGVPLAASHLSNGVVGSGNVVLRSSPDLLGIPTAPTAAVDTNTAQLATTGYVLGQASTALPLMDGTATSGSPSTRYAREGHVHPIDTSRAPLASPSFTGLVQATGGFNVNATISAAAYGAIQGTGNTLLQNKILAADAQPLFRIRGDGQLQWGPGGASSADTFLYRSAAGIIGSNSALAVGLNVDSSAGTSDRVNIGVLGGGGKITLGVSADVDLYRNTTPDLSLKTDNVMEAPRFRSSLSGIGGAAAFSAFQSASQQAFRNYLSSADGQPTISINGDGSIQWGPGGSILPDNSLSRYNLLALQTSGLVLTGNTLWLGAGADASLTRNAPGFLYTGGTLQAANSIGTGPIYSAAAGRLSASGTLGELSLLGRDRGSWTETGLGRWSQYVNANDLYFWTSGAVRVVFDDAGNPSFRGKNNPQGTGGQFSAANWTHGSNYHYNMDRSSINLTALFDYVATLIWELQRTGIIDGVMSA